METIGIAVAEGMRKGILAQREREGLTGPHPYAALDMAREEDRRIIASVYRSMAEAMEELARREAKRAAKVADRKVAVNG